MTGKKAIVLPGGLVDEMERIAAEHGVKPVDVVRKLLKFGLMAVALSKSDDTMLIIRENGVDRQLVFFDEAAGS